MSQGGSNYSHAWRHNFAIAAITVEYVVPGENTNEKCGVSAISLPPAGCLPGMIARWDRGFSRQAKKIGNNLDAFVSYL
jgi:hypothetical protein